MHFHFFLITRFVTINNCIDFIYGSPGYLIVTYMYKSLLNFQYFSNIIGVCRQCRSKLIHLDAKSKHVYVPSACDEESTQPQVRYQLAL